MPRSVLDQPEIHRLDSLKVYDSIVSLPSQIEQAWEECSALPLPRLGKLATSKSAKNIILAGMGGSALSGRIIRSLDQYILNVPLEVVTNYRLPNYVNQETLVILSSYSGETEETLSAAHDALKRKAKIFVIATGGTLLTWAKKQRLDRYQIDPKFNPSGQPRLGLGYLITAVFAILSRGGFLNFGARDIAGIDRLLNGLTTSLRREAPLETNPAKLLAEKIRDRAVVLISANHLVGTSHAIKNMLNENSKAFCVAFDLPELNHHFLEGLSFPRQLAQTTHFLIINSEAYPKLIQARLAITRQILAKHQLPSTVIKPESEHPNQQVFETLYFGAFLSYYLALIHGVDPGPIPSVEYLKKELARL